MSLPPEILQRIRQKAAADRALPRPEVVAVDEAIAASNAAHIASPVLAREDRRTLLVVSKSGPKFDGASTESGK